MRTLVILLTFAAVAPFAAGDAPAFERSGTILVGAHAVSVLDACNVIRFWPGNPYVPLPVEQSPQEGVDSSCFALPGGLAGRSFVVTGHDATGLSGTLYGIRACMYYESGELWGCDDVGRVPDGTALVSIIPMSGALIEWTFTIQ